MFIPEKLCGFWDLEDFRPTDFSLSTVYTFCACMNGLLHFSIQLKKFSCLFCSHYKQVVVFIKGQDSEILGVANGHWT